MKAFITNLGKYNEGELIGKWIALPISNEELNKVLEEIEINEEYEEYFFTDYDECYGADLGEYESIEHLNEIAEKLEEWDEDALEAVIDIWGIEDVLDSSPNDYILLADINDDYDLGQYYAVDVGYIDMEKLGHLANYFDFEAYGRDIRLEADGAFSCNGWLERI